MSTTIYTHPDGHEITVGDGLLTACTSDGFALSMPIGPAGLRDVAAKLLALADADEADAAERAGAALGGKLLALHKLEHFDRAAGGFAAAIVSVLEVGVANLPKFDEVTK